MPVSHSFFEYVLKRSTPSNGFKVLLAISMFYLYKYRSHAIGTRRRLDLKQPKGAVPFLGHLALMASVPPTELYEFLVKQNVELGPVWSITLPGFGRMIQIDNPDNLEHVLRANYSSYGKGTLFVDMMSDALGDGIFTADGAKWKFQRQLAVSIFSVKAFREFTGNIFVLEGKKVIDILGKVADDGTVIDIQDLLLQYTLDVFGTVSFGKSFGCLNGIDQVAPFAEAIDDLLEISARRINDPIWKIRERFNGTTEKIASDKKMIHDYAQNIIDKRRREGYHAEKKDLLQMFMSGKDDLGESLSDNLIIDNIVTFTAGGRDSTAHALTWMFYLLLRDGTDADIMENLVREADDVLEGQDPTYDTYKKQKYTEACFNEALRIYPVAPRNLRHCEVDDILPDGTKVYAGEWVAWSSYVMGRSELVWGADAKEYKPSRWMNTEKPPASKFNSFLLGPRVCIGQQFATIEALTIIGMILQKFNLELEDPSRVPTYRPSMAFPMAGGLNIRVSWRT